MRKEISLKLRPIMTKREFFKDLLCTLDIIYIVLGAGLMAFLGFVIVALLAQGQPWASSANDVRLLFIFVGLYLVSLIVVFFGTYKGNKKELKQKNDLDIKRFDSILNFFPQSIDYLLDSQGRYHPRFWIMGTDYSLTGSLKFYFNHNSIHFQSPDYDIIFNLEKGKIIMDDIVTNNFTKNEIHLLMMRLDSALLSLGREREERDKKNYEKNIENLRYLLR